MSRRVGVVMDPIAGINFKKDTTLGLLWAARDRGWSLFYMEQRDLFIDAGVSRAMMRPLQVFDDPNNFYALDEPANRELAELDVILMRKDPPFDMEFFYTTHLLEEAESKGTLIVNRCESLRNCNEKLFATHFPHCCPPLLVSRDPERLRGFHGLHGDVIFKPLDGMGGSNIFRVKPDDPNLSVILESLTQHGSETIMAQKYLPEISDGDKRILMINGTPVPWCLARIPLAGETRGNLAAGGNGRVQPLSERDQWIAEQVGPALRERGLFFVGLDVIGDYLTEINVTSPTCLREIEREASPDIAGSLMSCIETELGSLGR
ncbi:glutathione synthase [Luminiphilus syltensis]|nr:glutathione synthase [Luminiphilus syltensis]